MSERLDFTKPPPGYDVQSRTEDQREVFRYVHEHLEGVSIGEPCERREQAVALAWNRYKEVCDPPDVWLSKDGRSLWSFGLDGERPSLARARHPPRARQRPHCRGLS